MHNNTVLPITDREPYSAPAIEIVELCVELGFAQSQVSSNEGPFGGPADLGQGETPDGWDD